MLKVEETSSTKSASGESTPSVSPQLESDETANENKLSLLVKAAEKLVDEEQKSREINVSESANISKLNAFVHSIKEAKNAQNVNYPIFIGKNGKPTRPFKAYPKESLSLPIGGQSTSFLDETRRAMPLTVNTSSSASSSCSSSPIAVLGPTANLNNILAQNKHMLSTDSLLGVISALTNGSNADPSSPHQPINLSAHLKQSDLTSLNLNDLSTFDFTSLAFNPHDFCVQHRKRIQQAQERVLKKQTGESESPRRRNSSGGSRKRVDTTTVVVENSVVDSTQSNTIDSSHDEYMNYPPKKRHRIQNKKCNDDEPTSSSSSQTEGKNETPVNSPSSTGKPLESSKASVRSRQSSADEIDKDEAYRERRRKNNEAAKRSRDARRAKEDDIALRAALLERENLQLKVELAQLKQETTRLRCLLYNS